LGWSASSTRRRLPEAAIHAFWHARFHRDPANQWLRARFFELFSDGAA